MSWRKNPATCSFIWLFICLGLCACGVKGDPLPPERPPDLGRGRPTYKGASEEIHMDKTQSKDVDSDHKKKADDSDDAD
jgi:hypothetical protein